MYIIDQIEQIYDRSLTGTPDEVTAAYLLANLRSVPSTSLSEMSREIGVSKGYLSGFFSRMTSEGTFASFQNALEQELGYSMPDSSQPERMTGRSSWAVLTAEKENAKKACFLS